MPARCLYSFEPVSIPLLTDVVVKLKSPTSPLDTVPTHFLNRCMIVLVHGFFPCLISGYVPVFRKHGMVRSVLKRPNLHRTDLSNFRPISNLPFISKILEKNCINAATEFP